MATTLADGAPKLLVVPPDSAEWDTISWDTLGSFCPSSAIWLRWVPRRSTGPQRPSQPCKPAASPYNVGRGYLPTGTFFFFFAVPACRGGWELPHSTGSASVGSARCHSIFLVRLSGSTIDPSTPPPRFPTIPSHRGLPCRYPPGLSCFCSSSSSRARFHQPPFPPHLQAGRTANYWVFDSFVLETVGHSISHNPT